MEFENFKKVFDESFGKVTPKEFVQRMKNLGYEFAPEYTQESASSEFTEIKIDQTTLPKDGQKVKWQTTNDFDLRVWKEGVFSSGENLFLLGFNEDADKWDMSSDVLHWVSL